MSIKLAGNRKIYDINYYRAQAILKDSWFVDKIIWLRRRFAEVGCSVPPYGFKKYSDYEKWNNKFWDIYIKMSQSDEFLSKEKEITGGKEKYSSKEYFELEAFKEKFLPPIYGEIFREILEHFDIEPDDKGFRDFLEQYVFFGNNEYPNTRINTVFIRSEKTNKMELFVRIFGYTKKEDIIKNWHFIAHDQKSLPDYIGKSKKWESFDRDIEIYNLYKKLKNKKSNGQKIPLDMDIYAELHHEYEKIGINTIRNIISKTAKRLGESSRIG